MKLATYLYSLETKELFHTIRLIGGFNFNTINQLIFKQDNFLFLYIYRWTALFFLKQYKQPDWCFFELSEFAFDDISYYSRPINFSYFKYKKVLSKLMSELQHYTSNYFNWIWDIIFDSVSIIKFTTFFLMKIGLFFKSSYESMKLYSYLVCYYIGRVVMNDDNFLSTINAIIFNEGSFCFLSKDNKCKVYLTTYFRTHSEDFAQFERTLIILEECSSLVYFEGCSAPLFLESQLHVAVVELFIKNHAKLKYSTIQNWYRGNQTGEGGVYNLTTKRGFCMKNSFLNWIQIEIGSLITWKYPSTSLIGSRSATNFVALSMLSDYQIADTGTKVVHIGLNTKSFILSKSISLNTSNYTFRGLVKIHRTAYNSYNYTECNSLLIGLNAFTSTLPYNIINNSLVYINQEAVISKIELNFLFFLLHRGLNLKHTLLLLIYGYCYRICSKLSTESELEIPLAIVSRTRKIFS